MSKKFRDIEIMPGVTTTEENLSWFIGRMFNPEDNIWVWIRRIANILTIPILIILIVILLGGR